MPLRARNNDFNSLTRRDDMNWIMSRMKEPSSYAAAGGAVVGIGVLINEPIVIIIGVVGGALGFLLKEKGVL
jgi:4-amino-4-deoxy-L-arabinose transferase-like glycosyltransferase